MIVSAELLMLPFLPKGSDPMMTNTIEVAFEKSEGFCAKIQSLSSMYPYAAV
jgi:hypothetical protein